MKTVPFWLSPLQNCAGCVLLLTQSGCMRASSSVLSRASRDCESLAEKSVERKGQEGRQGNRGEQEKSGEKGGQGQRREEGRRKEGGRTHVNPPPERRDAGADDRVLAEREELRVLEDREVRVADRRELCARRGVRSGEGMSASGFGRGQAGVNSQRPREQRRASPVSIHTDKPTEGRKRTSVPISSGDFMSAHAVKCVFASSCVSPPFPLRPAPASASLSLSLCTVGCVGGRGLTFRAAAKREV